MITDPTNVHTIYTEYTVHGFTSRASLVIVVAAAVAAAAVVAESGHQISLEELWPPHRLSYWAK